MYAADDTLSYYAFLLERCDYSDIATSFYRQQDISLTAYGGQNGFVWSSSMQQDV